MKEELYDGEFYSYRCDSCDFSDSVSKIEDKYECCMMCGKEVKWYLLEYS